MIAANRPVDQSGDDGDSSAFTLSPLQAGPPCCIPHPLIKVDALSLHYGQKAAFEDITLTINQNCITALIGPSGCGKTSFLTCLNRLTDLIPGCRVTGRVTIGPIDVHAPDTDLLALRRRVGMIFQKPNPFPLSIRKNMELPLREHGMRRHEQREETLITALQDVGLWDEVKDHLDSPAMTLSGGQQQRLCFARAMVLQPEVLLMDEPCSALDPISSGVVEDLIMRLRHRFTILIVTHNLAQARRIADYSAMFWVRNGSGQLIEHGPSEQLFDTPHDSLTRAYVNGRKG